MTPRQQFLTDVTKSFLEARVAWVESETPYITAGLEQAVDDLVESFGEGDIPGELRRLERTVTDELAPHWSAWKRVAALSKDNTLLPSGDFWKAVDHLEDALQLAEPRPVQEVETIAELKAQKVSDAQICKIYGWIDGNGTPEIWRLQEEIREPGKHTENWVNPNERRRQEQEAREKDVSKRIANRQASKIKQLTEPGPESIETCLRQGLSLRQTMKITKKNRDEILAEAQRLGLPAPPENYEDPRTKRSPMEPEIAEETARAFDAQQNRRGRAPQPAPVDDDDDLVFDPDVTAEAMGETVKEGEGTGEDAPGGAMTLEQEIVTYHQQGMEPAAIAENVKLEGKSGLRKVNAIIKRFSEDPAAFGVTA